MLLSARDRIGTCASLVLVCPTPPWMTATTLLAARSTAPLAFLPADGTTPMGSTGRSDAAGLWLAFGCCRSAIQLFSGIGLGVFCWLDTSFRFLPPWLPLLPLPHSRKQRDAQSPTSNMAGPAPLKVESTPLRRLNCRPATWPNFTLTFHGPLLRRRLEGRSNLQLRLQAGGVSSVPLRLGSMRIWARVTGCWC